MRSGSPTYAQIKESCRKEYDKIISVYSPALKEIVYFNSQGFKHLRFKVDGTPRNPKEAIYKLNLISYIKKVVSTAESVQEYRKRNNTTYSSLVTRIERKGFVKVIVRRVGNGRLHFWSVMSRRA